MLQIRESRARNANAAGLLSKLRMNQRIVWLPHGQLPRVEDGDGYIRHITVV